MSDPKETPWQRIEKIMQAKGIHKISDFARLVGMERAESLYMIRRGKNNISIKMAEKIATAFPDIDRGYLLTGKSNGRTVKLPYFITDPVHRYRSGGPADNYVSVPYDGVPGLSFATVNNEQEPIRGILPNAVIIVEEVTRDNFIEDKPHLIETTEGLLLRLISLDRQSGRCRIYSDNPAKPSSSMVPLDNIISIFALRYVLNIY